MIFSDKLQIMRKSRGITQESLAEQLNVSRQAVAKWEGGMAYPDITNLIQLSNLFHTTIDYLVKDNDCAKNPGTQKESNLDAIIRFRLNAIKNTYAGYGTNCESSRTNSHDYSFSEGDFTYYDTWLGGERFAGEEAVWEKDMPVYAMNYYGRALSINFSGDFLKEALRNATEDIPFRGPALYEAGEYIYKNQVVGDLTCFQGYEEILYQNEKVYECYYHGGLLKQ